MQIMGVGPEDGSQPDELIPEEAGVLIDGRPVAVNLVACKPTYWLYRPVMKPESTKVYDRNQR